MLKKIRINFTITFSLAAFFLFWALTVPSEGRASSKKYKVFHIMSYHSPWEWTDEQFNGFKESLKDLDIEYKVFQMDSKHKSSPEWLEKVGKEARELISAWRPDLVYTTDDNVQKYVVAYYYGEHKIVSILSSCVTD